MHLEYNENMKTNNPIKFGTDGWRAVIAEEFTFENVRICAQGLADYHEAERTERKGTGDRL